jgi:hypothetical protein
MIKKVLKSVVLASALMSTALMAEVSEYEYNTYSLVGIEGGYGNLSYDGSNKTEKINMNHAGIKIGGQTDNYRLFLSVRAFDSSDLDYARTYGIEGQYLFNFSKYANFYLGVNGGVADIKFYDPAFSGSVSAYDPYLGGDAGFNVHLGEMADLEFGARIMNIQSEVDANGKTYKLDSIISGYASIIFKYKMD